MGYIGFSLGRRGFAAGDAIPRQPSVTGVGRMLMQDSAGDPRIPGEFDNVLHRAIVEAAVDAIVVIDEQGVIQMANPATDRVPSGGAPRR